MPLWSTFPFVFHSSNHPELLVPEYLSHLIMQGTTHDGKPYLVMSVWYNEVYQVGRIIEHSPTEWEYGVKGHMDRWIQQPSITEIVTSEPRQSLFPIHPSIDPEMIMVEELTDFFMQGISEYGIPYIVTPVIREGQLDVALLRKYSDTQYDIKIGSFQAGVYLIGNEWVTMEMLTELDMIDWEEENRSQSSSENEESMASIVRSLM